MQIDVLPGVAGRQKQNLETMGWNLDNKVHWSMLPCFAKESRLGRKGVGGGEEDVVDQACQTAKPPALLFQNS